MYGKLQWLCLVIISLRYNSCLRIRKVHFAYKNPALALSKVFLESRHNEAANWWNRTKMVHTFLKWIWVTPPCQRCCRNRFYCWSEKYILNISMLVGYVAVLASHFSHNWWAFIIAVIKLLLLWSIILLVLLVLFVMLFVTVCAVSEHWRIYWWCTFWQSWWSAYQVELNLSSQ